MEKKHRIRRRWQESDSDFQSTLKDVERELRGQLICKARTESRERAVLLHLKRKYPDGQGIRLSKQVASSSKRLRQAIKEYNSIQWPPQMSIFPAIDFQEACDPSWYVYFCSDDTIEEDDVSRSLKRRGIDALHMKTRAAMEKRMLYQEMRSVPEHLHQQHAFLCSAIKDTEQPGAKAALIQRLQQLERKRHQAIVMFHPHVPDIVPADNPHFYFYILFSHDSSSLLSKDQLLCSICVDVLTDLVPTPCGHNLCKSCIIQCWDKNQLCHCPLCNQILSKRTKLKINITLRKVADYFKKKSGSDKPEVLCDACSGEKLKALKSCLDCCASLCKTHLEFHNKMPKLKKHKLLNPVENLAANICQKHERALELFCRDDQTCMCQFCIETKHKNHNTVPIEEESRKRKVRNADKLPE
ncbi:uncharacterized protein LOC132854536 [Tachysurus vachellii]|uniref:uncharacterized protein LOC132854536 n=1 Tax=Tachysurus vachellii TaxID=175792 RepID=UPI00296AE7C1|nr:uncharacterized protein LOC132854536 [Tachysurus vachellii]